MLTQWITLNRAAVSPRSAFPFCQERNFTGEFARRWGKLSVPFFVLSEPILVYNTYTGGGQIFGQAYSFPECPCVAVTSCPQTRARLRELEQRAKSCHCRFRSDMMSSLTRIQLSYCMANYGYEIQQHCHQWNYHPGFYCCSLEAQCNITGTIPFSAASSTFCSLMSIDLVFWL